MSRLRAPAPPHVPPPGTTSHLAPPRSSASQSGSQASHSSRLSSSLSATFHTLTPSDISFFDSVISRVQPSTASDFAALKRAYNHTRAVPLPLRCDEARDAHLWDKTLCLLQVRGTSWRERWDAVKQSLGLELEEGEGESTTGAESEVERASWAETGQATYDLSQASIDAHQASPSRPRLSEAQQQAHRARDVAWRANDGDSSTSDDGDGSSSDETAQPTRVPPPSFRTQIDSLAARARVLSLASGTAAPGATTPRRHVAAVAPASSTRPTRPKLPPADQLRAVYAETEGSSSSSSSSGSSGEASVAPRTARREPPQTAAAAAAPRRARFSEPQVQPSVLGAAPLPHAHAQAASSSRRTRIEANDASSPSYDAHAHAHAQPPSSSRKASGQPLISALDRLSVTHAPQQAPPPLSSSPSPDPEPRTAHQRRLDTVLTRSRAERAALAASEAARLLALEEAQYAHLTTRADLHYARVLLRPAFAWWARKSERNATREENAKRAGEVVLLAKTWEAWRRGVKREKEGRGEADRVGRVRCTLTAWRVWRRKMAEREEMRREERLGVLREAYAVAKRGREERVRKEAWLKWRRTFHLCVASYFRKAHLLRGALSVWQLAFVRNRRLRADEARVVTYKRETKLGEAFEAWRRKARLRAREREMSARVEERLKSASWEAWKRDSELSSLARAFSTHRLQRAHLHAWQGALQQRTTQRRKEALADRWRARRSKRAALQAWTARLQAVRQLAQCGEQLLALRQGRLVKTALKTWQLNERGALLLRKNQAVLLRLVLEEWHYQYRELVDRLERRALMLSVTVDANALRHAWETWSVNVQRRREMALFASARDERLTLAKGWTKWRTKNEEHRVRKVNAEVLSEYVAYRAALERWKVRLRERRVGRLERRSKRVVVRNAFEVWRVRTSERAQERLAVASLLAKADERLTRVALLIWTQRIIEVRSLALQASERADARAKDKAWTQWRAAYDRHCDLDALALSFLDVKREDWTRRMFGKWLVAARAERKRRLMAEALLEQREKESLVSAWNTWCERFAEATLRPLEYEVMLRRQDRVVLGVMTQWQAKTRVLPALRFDHARLYSLSWAKWRAALPLATQRRRAAQVDRLGMLGKAFRHWASAAKTKRSVRAAARFGGPSMVRLRNAALAKRAGPFTRQGSSSPRPSPPAATAAVVAPPPNMALPRHMRNAGAETPTPATGPTNALEMSSSNLSSLFGSPAHARHARAQEASPSLAQLASLTSQRRRSLSPSKPTPRTESRQASSRPAPPTRTATGNAVPLGDSMALRRWAHGVATSSSMPHIPALRSPSPSRSAGSAADSTEPTSRTPRIVQNREVHPPTPGTAPSSAPSRRTPRLRSPSPGSRAARSEITARPARRERTREREEEERRERERARVVLASLRARRRERGMVQTGETSGEDG